MTRNNIKTTKICPKVWFCHKNMVTLWQNSRNMAAFSAYNTIKSQVEMSNKGTLFFPEGFAPIGSSDAVRSALVRLCQSGELVRVAQGIYFKPKIDTKWGSGMIPPSIEEIAEGIAKRDKVRIAPTGAYVLNQLGLSTQIPANVVYLTDGSQRRVSVGKGKGILFKHSSEMRIFAYQSRLMQMIVTAMREIGEGNLTDEQMVIIKSHLKNVSEEDYQNDIQLAPIWVREKLSEK